MIDLANEEAVVKYLPCYSQTDLPNTQVGNVSRTGEKLCKFIDP